MAASGGGGKPLMSRLWEIAALAIVFSIAAQLVQEYVIPLLPYVMGVVVIGLVAYVVITRMRRW